MSIEEILQLPVEDLALPDAHLFLWTTAAHMEHAFGLMRFWGFTFKAAVVWVKTSDIITRILPDNRVKHFFSLRAMNELMEADAVSEADQEPKGLTPILSRGVAEFVTTEPEHTEDARVRIQIGPGAYLRHATELCLFGSRGHATGKVRTIPNVIFAPRTENHSEKPKIIHQIAELLSPAPFLEMFARDQFNERWDVWGNDPAIASKSITLPNR